MLLVGLAATFTLAQEFTKMGFLLNLSLERRRGRFRRSFLLFCGTLGELTNETTDLVLLAALTAQLLSKRCFASHYSCSRTAILTPPRRIRTGRRHVYSTGDFLLPGTTTIAISRHRNEAFTRPSTFVSGMAIKRLGRYRDGNPVDAANSVCNSRGLAPVPISSIISGRSRRNFSDRHSVGAI